MEESRRRGLKVEEVAKAVQDADVVMILLPDENIPDVYKNDIEPNIRKGRSAGVRPWLQRALQPGHPA